METRIQSDGEEEKSDQRNSEEMKYAVLGIGDNVIQTTDDRKGGRIQEMMLRSRLMGMERKKAANWEAKKERGKGD